MARVCNLAALPTSDLTTVLQSTEVAEVWGVGRRISQQLNDAGINNVLQLAQLDPATVRKRWSVVLERTVRELQGQSCIGLEHQPPPKKEIAHTRSFGQPVTALADLIEAVSEFASRAAAKLRLQGGVAAQINVFIHTSPFRPGAQYSRSTVVPLRRPTADTLPLVHAAVRGLQSIYKPGFKYAKAGVMLLHLQDGAIEQLELSLDTEPSIRGRLMATLETLNDRFGRGTVHITSAGVKSSNRSWSMQQNLLTPQYTTSWFDLPVARA